MSSPRRDWGHCARTPHPCNTVRLAPNAPRHLPGDEVNLTELTTVKADLVRRLAEVAKAHGVNFLDIGVSGGTAVALDGGMKAWRELGYPIETGMP